jgi:hypothetical protein
MTTSNEFAIKKRPIWKLQYVDIAEKLRAGGFTLDDIAYIFGISTSTLHNWCKVHPEMKEAIFEGKESAKREILAKAFRAACGYEYVESNEKFDSEGKLKERSVFHKHAESNPKLIMWLICNLAPDEWKSEHKILVERDDLVTVKLDGKSSAKQLEQLAGKLFGDGKNTRKTIFESSSSIVDDSRGLPEPTISNDTNTTRVPDGYSEGR